MKYIWAVIFVLFFISPSFSAENPKTTPSKDKPAPIKRVEHMVAVFDLEIIEGVTKGISRPLSESIRREILMAGMYELIDRSNMDKILSEHKFQASGCVSSECIVEAGQLLGVGKIVTGSIGLVGKTYYLSLSIINVETGRIEQSSEDRCKCEMDDLIDSTKRLVKQLLAEKAKEIKTVQEAKKTAEKKDPIDMEFVFVKGGCYQMGNSEGGFFSGEADEKPVHEVCLDDFYMGKYEVTQGQWKAIMGKNPSHFKDCGDNCPVENVSWHDVNGFISKLNKKAGDDIYLLPTEAEWEYAAKSGGKNEKWAGTSNETELNDYVWYSKNSGSKTHPVGQKKPNGLGLYDMSGNVLEWVRDGYYHKAYTTHEKNNPVYKISDFHFFESKVSSPVSSQPNPTQSGMALQSVNQCVLRGGSWDDKQNHIRTSVRFNDSPSNTHKTYGFRLVKIK